MKIKCEKCIHAEVCGYKKDMEKFTDSIHT